MKTIQKLDRKIQEETPANRKKHTESLNVSHKNKKFENRLNPQLTVTDYLVYPSNSLEYSLYIV